MSYLNRSGVSLNSINYADTLSNSNQILERTNTGRNDIAWNNPPSSIPSGLNATPSQVLSGYKFVGSAGTLQTGTMPTQGGSTITPGTSNKTAVSAGKYVSGNVVVVGDTDLISSNIRNGKNIFGVNGSVREYKLYQNNLKPSSSTKQFIDTSGRSRNLRYLDVNIGFYPLCFAAYRGDGSGNHFQCAILSVSNVTIWILDSYSRSDCGFSISDNPIIGWNTTHLYIPIYGNADDPGYTYMVRCSGYI